MVKLSTNTRSRLRNYDPQGNRAESDKIAEFVGGLRPNSNAVQYSMPWNVEEAIDKVLGTAYSIRMELSAYFNI